MPINTITATATDTYSVGALAQFTFDIKVHHEALERPCKIGGVRAEWEFKSHNIGWSVNTIGGPQISYFHKAHETCVARDGMKGMMDVVHVQLDFVIQQKVGLPYWTPFTGGGVAGVTVDTKHVTALVIVSADGAVKQSFKYKEL